ncbi:MAG: beta-hexosaminidase [Ruminococcaceae bacterium]|nr:beta-hexosaminidase [Oscillospiraceae bacterium]
MEEPDPDPDPAQTGDDQTGQSGTDGSEGGGTISASLASFSPEVQAQIAAMSTRELLTQMFIATYDGSWATAGYAAEYGFGGYITFAEDYENDTPESFREGIDRVTASSKIPPLYAVDEEGGTVTRASKYPGYRRYPFLSPREVYEGGGLDGIRLDAAEKAELLKKLGLNYNLAPVADISVNSWDYMYNRSPGQDAETTASIVETIVTVFNQRGVASTVKHFPGYGAVSDTHTAMAWDGRTVEELESFDLIPFQRAMAAGVPSVMVSHIITALDPDRPASVSSAVVDYIRTKMGYDGVLITDDMRMNGILDFCTSGNGSLEAILAGYDLICCTNWPEQFPVVWSAVESGSLTRERLELSAARVLRMKQELGIWKP